MTAYTDASNRQRTLGDRSASDYELERHILRMIEDSASDGKAMSKYNLASTMGIQDEFSMRMWLLTLEVTRQNDRTWLSADAQG